MLTKNFPELISRLILMATGYHRLEGPIVLRHKISLVLPFALQIITNVKFCVKHFISFCVMIVDFLVLCASRHSHIVGKVINTVSLLYNNKH